MKSRFENQHEQQRALEEVQIHSGIGAHPNVARLLAAEETSRAILLVTPYTPCGDLWELTRYGKTYCEGEVRNAASQMLSALHHIHTQCDLVHADIKPHNFLLFRTDGRFIVQLCDFGLAQRPDTPGGVITFRGLRGTSGWIPPELLLGMDYGFAVDLFPIGLILFRMLSGYAPFDPPSSCTKHKVEFDDMYWCHVTAPGLDLVERLLSANPADRGTAQEVCRHEWFAGPPPAPSAEQLKALTRFGPAPSTDVLFWPADYSFPLERALSYADSSFCQDDVVMDPVDGLDG